MRGALVLLLLSAAAGAAMGAQVHLGEGSDIELGGPGNGLGTFCILSDITFDDQNRLYVLDGARYDHTLKTLVGNLLVQVFDNAGHFTSQFSVKTETLGDRDQPARIAVDAQGEIYISIPDAGVVQRYSPAGALLSSYAIPGAYALTARVRAGASQIIVLPNLGLGKKHTPVDQASVIEHGTLSATPLRLSRTVSNAIAMTADSLGNLLVLADINQIYRFDPAGTLVNIIGGGTTTKIEDGSELAHTVAVDSKGQIYTMVAGNPGKVTRFSPDCARLAQRPGRFNGFQPWGVHGDYTPFAIDRNDRLWVGTVTFANPHPDPAKPEHFRPCVLRTIPDFLAVGPAVTESSTLGLGLNAELGSHLPYNVGTELAPTTLDFLVKPATRRVHEVQVDYHILDTDKHDVSHGTFDLTLADDSEARQSFAFTPPKWGHYAVECQISRKGTGERIAGVGLYLGFAPPYPGMRLLKEGESNGGWADPARQAFCGMSLIRLHPTLADLDKIEAEVDDSLRNGLTVLLQLSSLKECNAGFASTAVKRLMHKAKYWEVFNEPNLQMGPEAYVKVLAETAGAIRAVDPAAIVLGPTCCAINLDWYAKFYVAGGGKLCDIISLHDYEGNESIDPAFWRWKVGELRKIMADHGDGAKALWQTERAISGTGIFMYLGDAQAVRLTLHYDVLESLGIPNEHNLHYYINEGGYTSVPTWIWSRVGPYPAALCMRTRAAMISGRPFAGSMDFGPMGNKMFMGLRYADALGTTLTIRNLGTLDLPLTLQAAGDGEMELVDAYGNAQQLHARNGTLSILTRAEPQYLRFPAQRSVTVAPIDFGANIAAEATITYSGTTASDAAALTNGIFESNHYQDPNRNKQWVGDFPAGPQTLDLTFPHARTIGKVAIFAFWADNDSSALLDYDLLCKAENGWTTIQEVRTPCPETDLAKTSMTIANTWYHDTNFFVHEFAPVTTTVLRLVIRRTTFGFFADQKARDIRHKQQKAEVVLREIEVYGK